MKKLFKFILDKFVSRKGFTKNYFITKFEAIPANEIGEGNLSRHCALWHCGVRLGEKAYIPTNESTALIMLFGGKYETDYAVVYIVNDGRYEDGKTAKDRILNKLKSLNQCNLCLTIFVKLV